MNSEKQTTVKSIIDQMISDLKALELGQDNTKTYAKMVEIVQIMNNEEDTITRMVNQDLVFKEELCGLWMFLGKFGYELFLKSQQRSLAYINLSVTAWNSGMTYTSQENKMKCLKGCAISLLARNDITGCSLDLNQAVSLLDEVTLAPDGQRNSPQTLSILGMALQTRFNTTGVMEDLEHALYVIRKAVELAQEGHDGIQEILSNLGNTLQIKYECHGNMEDLEEALHVKMNVIKLTPLDDPNISGRLSNLGNAISSKFEKSGNIEDLEESINITRKALELTREGHQHLPRILTNLGCQLQTRFDYTSSLNDLEEAIHLHQRSVCLTSGEHPDMPKILINLGGALEMRFNHRGNMEDLNQAIHAKRRAVELLPESHADLPGMLNSLGSALLTKFESTGNFDDLEEASCVKIHAVHLSPEAHPDTPGILTNLGNLFLKKFNYTRNTEYLIQAIHVNRRAAELSLESHPAMPKILSNLGNALKAQFTHTGNMDNLEEAILVQRRSIELIPETHIDMPAILSNLGDVLETKFENTGNMDDLEQSIYVKRRSLVLTIEDHTTMPERLNEFATVLLTRFEHTANMEDLSQAITANGKAIELSPENHPLLQQKLSIYAHAHIKRFEVEGNGEDINQAIYAYRRAINLIFESHADMAGKLTNLAVALQMRYNYGKNVRDLEEAILAGKKAVELTPEYHHDISSTLNNLGTAFQSRFDDAGNMEDLEQAILIKKRCTELIQEGHPLMPKFLGNLGKALLVRFKCLREKVDLTDALDFCERALGLLPDGHPLNVMCHCEIANILSILASFEQSPYYINLSCLHFYKAINNPAYPPHTRIYAVQLWSSTHLSFQSADIVIDAFSVAFGLLPQVIPISYAIGHRFDRLKNIQNLAIIACTTAVMHGQYKKAVEWSDQGRGILWMQIHQLRSPIEYVHDVDPHLAAKLKYISSCLQTATDRSNSRNGLATVEEMQGLQIEAQKFKALADEWETLLQQARSHAGLEKLLMPIPYVDMVGSIPKTGKVIIVNVGHIRSDALILTHDDSNIIHVPLPCFTHKEADELRKMLYFQLNSCGVRTRESRAGRLVRKESSPGNMSYILSTLWLELVKPIFQNMDIKLHAAPEVKQRIWWCPTGPLTFLPIHAAGIYGNMSKRGSVISDYAVSSYVPTLSALINASKSAEKAKGVEGVLAVSQADSPGFPPLPATIPECKYIHDEFVYKQISVKHVDGEEATQKDILSLLEKYSWVHLACHGSQDLETPTKSAFYLHEGKIELLDIIRKNLINADFAFLSACQTATGTPKLSSEATHLAAGMLSAGYRSVVATMWSISDEQALSITQEFYRYLLKDLNEGQFPNSTCTAEALQYATQQLREKLGDSDDDSFMMWVPYVHIGL